MARFITVSVQCDWTDCLTVAPEGEGIVVYKTLSIDGKQGREFLLCKNHLDDFEAVVLPLMQKGIKVENVNGRPTKASKSARTSTETSTVGSSSAEAEEGDEEAVHPSLVCKAPSCRRDGRPVSNRVGMAQHVIKAHGYADLASYEAEYGPVAAIPRKSPRKSPSS